MKKQVETKRLAMIIIRLKNIFDKLPTLVVDTEGPLSKACPGCCQFFLKKIHCCTFFFGLILVLEGEALFLEEQTLQIHSQA